MMIYLQAIDSPADKVKFEQVYLEYRAFMFHIALQILRNEQDAEDAVHNAFLSVAKNMDKVGDPTSQKTRGYIAIITERKAIDLYRERKKYAGEELLEGEAGVLMLLPEEHNLVWCISSLPPRYRQVIMLKYSHGYSVKEIAEILDITPAAASKLDQRAKKKLNAICREEGIL